MKDTSSGLWSSCCPARLRADAGCILSPASTAPPGARFSSVELIGDLVPGDPRAGATLIDRREHDPARPSAASPPADCGPWPAKTTPAMRCKRPQPQTKTCRSAGKHGSHSDSLAPHASTAQAEPQPTATARQVAIGPQAQSGWRTCARIPLITACGARPTPSSSLPIPRGPLLVSAGLLGREDQLLLRCRSGRAGGRFTSILVRR